VDFTEFAYAANVIAISVNYRLGALGFNPLRAIKGEDPAQASGNFAILDAIRGLSWMRDNIVSFGGNPGNITIAGFSSGGRDVMELLISPDAKGYFQKAISFSGGMTTAEIEPSQKIFAEHLAPLVVEDHVKPYLSEAEEWLLSDAPEVRDYLLGLPAGRLAKAFGPAYIRMKEFPHLYPDGIVLDSMGFKSKTFTTVPLMMETRTDEFSIYAAQDPYFAPYVADRSILTNEKMRKEFEFAKKYGSAMYRLFNADAPASMLVGKYRAPIYTLTIDYGDDPKIVGDAAALLLGSVHGIWIPCVTGRATSTTADFPIHAFDNPGFQDMKRMIQQYIGNFMRTGNPNGNGLPEWQKWMTAKDGFGSLVIHTDGNTAAAGQITAHETYEDVIRALEADDSIDPEAKDIIIHHVLSGRWWSGPIDRHFSHKEN
jgi:para-nitrobenzyl esterase